MMTMMALFFLDASYTIISLFDSHYFIQVLKSQIFVEQFSRSKSKTFLDYISEGCELNLMVAIDFTGMGILVLSPGGDNFYFIIARLA